MIHECSAMQDDIALVTRIENGDMKAFEQLVNEYKNKLFSFLMKMTYSKQDSEEILQEVFIRVYKNLNKYNDRWMFSTWLYRIAINTYKSYMKKTRKINTVPIDENVINKNVRWNGNPEDAYENNEKRREVILLIGQLKEKQRIPLILKYIKGFSYAEIGIVMGISEEAAKMRVLRAKKNICKSYMERNRGDI